MVGPLYEEMTHAQAEQALAEFVAERGLALAGLRTSLLERGVDPDRLLTGSLESVPQVWEWITARATAHGVVSWSLVEDPTRPFWPSWARHGMLVDPHPPARTLALVDGFTSYLAALLIDAVPEARWRVGEHRLETYPMAHYPVLTADHHQIFLPALPLYSIYQSAHGRDPMSGAEMAAHTRRTITALRGQGPVAETAEEPLILVVAEVDCFDVGLRPDLPVLHPGLVDRLIGELTDRDGVVSVHRYDTEALVIDAPDWNEIRLKLWLTLWLQRNLHTDH